MPDHRPTVGVVRRSARGQATVEVALVLPVVVLFALAVVQVALVGRDRLAVVHGAREGARAAAVGASSADVRAAVAGAGGLDPTRVGVDIRRLADDVEVTVRYESSTNLPVIGRLLADVEVVASARMRREQPP